MSRCIFAFALSGRKRLPRPCSLVESEAEFTGTVEQITGRKVWAFVSGMDTQRDVSSEVFYLEPVASA